MDHSHVKIMVTGGSRPGVEQVPAKRVRDADWQLIRSPLYATEVAAGDVIRLLNDQTGEFEVLEHGGNVCVQFYLSRLDSDNLRATTLVANALSQEVESLGGRLDGRTAGLVSFTVPVRAGFPAIERIFQGAIAKYPGTQWQYANVYHPQTGEPLRWWDAPQP